MLKWFLNEAKLLAEKVNSKNQAGCVLDVDLIMIQKVDALCFNLICAVNKPFQLVEGESLPLIKLKDFPML